MYPSIIRKYKISKQCITSSLIIIYLYMRWGNHKYYVFMLLYKVDLRQPVTF